MDLKRRDFLKTVGLTAAGSLLPGCTQASHKLIPYLLPDDEIIPGIANWYATVCQECEAGCGIIVRVMEGRAKKIEGNPTHPLNQGKLCAVGQASLQGLYNPDRIRGPLQRDGTRGEEKFRPIGWEEGLSRWVSALQKHPKGAVMVSRPVFGTLAHLFSEFMRGISGELHFYRPSDEVAVRAANRLSFGIESLPQYDLANATYLLSFGAPFVDRWLSPVHFGVAYGKMRQGRPGVRGQFVQVEPRLSLTGASADRWVPIRPGTEGLLAMGIGQAILKRGRGRLAKGDRSRFERLYAPFPVDRIEAQTEVPREDIIRLADEFSSAAAPLAIGGGIAAAQTNGTDTLMAINALNILSGNLNRPGGIRFFQPPRNLPFEEDPPSGEETLEKVRSRFDEGRRSVLMLYQANPLFTLPPSMRFGEVFKKADFIVSFSSFMDESTAMADLILPDHFFLENWSDHLQKGIISVPAVGLAQPVVMPLYDTRAVGDLVLSAARAEGMPKVDLPWKNFREMMQGRWRDLSNLQAFEDPFETTWIKRLQQGGWWGAPGDPLPVQKREPPASIAQARFEGDEKTFPFYFHPFPSLGLNDGAGANRPWLQELPDTVTTAVWGSWIEINPRTAERLGLRTGDMVRVISAFGQLEAPAVLFPGTRPDLISIPIGQGHSAYGRYAKGRGVNPLSILAPLVDQKSGALASGATRVRIERVGRPGNLVLIDQTAQGDKRNSGAARGEA